MEIIKMQTYKNYIDLESKAVEMYKLNLQIEPLENCIEASRMARKTTSHMIDKYTNVEVDLAKAQKWKAIQDDNAVRHAQNLAMHTEMLVKRAHLESEIARLKSY